MNLIQAMLVSVPCAAFIVAVQWIVFYFLVNTVWSDAPVMAAMHESWVFGYIVFVTAWGMMVGKLVEPVIVRQAKGQVKP